METKVRERALVVDDNAVALFTVSEVVKGLGFEVDEADGVLSAIELYESKSYDLVVSDINMPGDIDGIELARIMRRKRAGQPIILMTGHSERIGDSKGEFIVLAKPFEVGDLKRVLK